MTEEDCLRSLVVARANGASLNGKGVNEMSELDCLRALCRNNFRSLNGKGINEANEADCWRSLVMTGLP